MLMGGLLLGAPLGFACAADTPSLDNETARISYSLGYQVGGDFKRQGVAVDAAAMLKGVEDASSGAEPQMKPEEMQATINELRQKLVAEQRKRIEEQNAKLEVESKQFLEDNAKQAGVVTTESGLQYQIIEPGTGKTPGPTDQVTVNYRGTLVDGKEFDSSYKRNEPTSFKLDGVVKGWGEGLQLIKEGGKIKLFIPPALAYGERGPLAHRALIFDVELLSVGEPPKSEETQAPATGAKVGP
jgi:FKBP-type peptidyl-prolyl cis-trans isomerase